MRDKFVDCGFRAEPEPELRLPCVNPDCVDGVISAGCAIYRPLLKRPCPECNSPKRHKKSSKGDIPNTKPSGTVHVITAWNADREQKDCVVVTSLPLAITIRDALKGIWGGANVAISSRQVDEVPHNILAEIDVMEHPPKPTGFIGGGRHG